MQKEKLEAIIFLFRRIETDNNNQTTSEMLKDLKSALNELIITDF